MMRFPNLKSPPVVVTERAGIPAPAKPGRLSDGIALAEPTASHSVSPQKADVVPTSPVVSPVASTKPQTHAREPSAQSDQRGGLRKQQRSVGGALVTVHTFARAEGARETKGATVVCLPGLGDSAESFWKMGALAKPPEGAPGRELALLTFPPRTPPGTTPLAHQVDLLAHPASGLPQRFNVVASSYSTIVALEFALAHPDRVGSLVLVDPPINPVVAAGAALARPFASFVGPMVRFASPMVAAVFGTSLADAGAIAGHVEDVPGSEISRRLEDIAVSRVADRLLDLNIPVLIIHGTDDKVVWSPLMRELERQLQLKSEQRGADHRLAPEFAYIKGAGHVPYLSHPEEFNALVEGFLTRVDAGAP